MGDYEAGKPYPRSDGSLWVWNGQGDANDKANWSPYKAAAKAAPAPEAYGVTGVEGYTPTVDQLKKGAPLLASAAATALLPGESTVARAGSGALVGGAMGAYEAEPGHRMAGAATGAALGAGASLGTDALVGAGSILARNAAQRGERFATWLRDAAEAPDWSKAMTAMRSRLQSISNTLYRPIADKKVMSPAVRSALDAIEAKGWLPAELQGNKWPTIAQIQDLEKSLKSVRRTADEHFLTDLVGAVREASPEKAAADAAYAAESGHIRAMGLGARSAGKPAAEVEQAVQSLAPEYQKSFRTGVVYRKATQLEKRSTAMSAVADIMDMHPENKRLFATMFEGGENSPGFKAFMDEVGKEKSAVKAQEAFKKYGIGTAKWLARVAGTGAAMGAASRFFDGRDAAVDTGGDQQ